MDYIKEMLCENTGIALMDSGGVDGRAWQQNAKHDITKQPEGYFRWDCLYINTYHWLKERVEYHAELTDELTEYMETSDEWDYVGAREWVKSIDGELDGEVCYTYNCENQLNQDVQFSLFQLGKQYFAVIQSHNGADARGGMSTPKVFKIIGDSTSLFDFNYLTLEDDEGNEVKPWDAEEFGGVITEKETGRVLDVCMYH